MCVGAAKSGRHIWPVSAAAAPPAWPRSAVHAEPGVSAARVPGSRRGQPLTFLTAAAAARPGRPSRAALCALRQVSARSGRGRWRLGQMAREWASL